MDGSLPLSALCSNVVGCTGDADAVPNSSALNDVIEVVLSVV